MNSDTWTGDLCRIETLNAEIILLVALRSFIILGSEKTLLVRSHIDRSQKRTKVVWGVLRCEIDKLC